MHSFRYGSIMAAQDSASRSRTRRLGLRQRFGGCCIFVAVRAASKLREDHRPAGDAVAFGSAAPRERPAGGRNLKKSGGLLLLLPAGRGKPLQIEGVEIDRVNVKRGVRAATNGVRNDLAREGK